MPELNQAIGIRKRDRQLRPRNQQDIRRKIETTWIIRRLQMHIRGDLKLTQTQISAAKILLDKTVSNAPIEISDHTVEVMVRFERDPDQWRTIEAEQPTQRVDASVRELLEHQPDQVKEHMALILDGVSETEQQAIYDRAIGPVLAAAARGEAELPVKELLERAEPEITEAAHGFGANLDVETEEEKAKLEDAVAKMQQHNAKVRARRK